MFDGPALATRYLDAFHYAKDGNFVLCQHSKKLDMDDSPLTDGAAYYVDNGKYAEYSRCDQPPCRLDRAAAR